MAHRPLSAVACAVALAAGAVHAQTCAAPTDAAVGSIVSLAGGRVETCAPLAARGAWRGGALIFSDSPEEPAAPGVLYRDRTLLATAAGEDNRIFVYHTNGGAPGKLRFSVLLTNRGTRAGRLTVTRHGAAGPSKDYLSIGKTAFARWLGASPEAPVTVAGGATVRLDASYETLLASRDELVHGIWDYRFDQPHEIAVCALGERGDALADCARLPESARDIHQRATFPHCDRVYAGAAALPFALEMAGNSPQDPNAQGIDRTDGTAVSLGGNYGVLYRMQLDVPGAATLLIQPLGGEWGGAARSDGIALLPSAVTAIGSSAQAAVAAKYAGSRVELKWMPTGGSSFPVRLVALPSAHVR